MTPRRRLAVAVLPLLVHAHTWAAQVQPAPSPPPDTAATDLSEVVVTATRIPSRYSQSGRSLSVIPRAQVAALPVTSVNELLAYTPGVDLTQRGPLGTQADIAIRGGTFNQTLVLLDGIPLADPQTGHFLLNLPLQPQDIERVEVLRGPAANAFGLNAFSGAVNFITRRYRQPLLRIGAAGGDNAYYDLNLTGALPLGRTYHQLSAARRGHDGYQRGTDLRLHNLLYQGDANFDAGRAFWTLGWNDRQFGAWKFYQSAPPDQYETNEVLNAHAGWQTSAERDWNLRAEAYFRRHNDDYRLFRTREDTARNIHQTDVLGAQFNLRRSLSDRVMLAVGGDVRREWLESTNLGDNRRTNAGLFLETAYQLAPQLTLRPSVYVNWFSPVGWNAFPALDVAFQASEALTLYANAGRAYRVPTYTELYLNRFQRSAVLGNANLAPEDALGYELGARYRYRGFDVQAAAYRRHADRLIDLSRPVTPLPVSPDNPLVFRNVNDITTTGGELTLTLQPQVWNAKSPLRYLQLGYNLLYLDRAPTELFSRYVFQYLRHQLTAQATVQVYKGLQASLATRYQARENLPTPYWLLDARLQYAAPRWTLFVEGSNLTQTRYADLSYGTELVYGPGRWLRAGITLTVFGSGQ